MRNPLRNLLKNRWALSTVVTTLIILVVSVLLAGVVTYFAINVTTTRVQEENLNISYQHLWYNVSNGAQAAFIVTNTGGRDVVFQKIAVRGQASAWTDVYTNATAVADPTYIDVTNASLATAVGNNPFILKSGTLAVVYVNHPDSVTVNDVGLTIAISVFTAQAIYYKETNVEAQP